MSAHEDAYEAALKGFDPDWGLEPENIAEAIDAFLAALPPSIVVDGKVVELGEAMAVLLRGNPHNGVVSAMVEGLANAAREVAE